MTTYKDIQKAIEEIRKPNEPVWRIPKKLYKKLVKAGYLCSMKPPKYKVSDIIKITEIPATVVGVQNFQLTFNNGDTLIIKQWNTPPVNVNQYYE